MGLYRRGKIYWFTISHNGRRIQESTGTDKKRLAESIYAKALSNALDNRWNEVEAKRRTFTEMKERYLEEHSAVHKTTTSQARDLHSFKPLTRFFDDCRLAEITPAAISDYKTSRRRDGVKAATIAKELELLRNALNIAKREWEWLDKTPFDRVKIERPNNKVERWLTLAEEESLMEHAPSWLQPIIKFTLHTGLRRSELVDLKWTDVDIQNSKLIVQNSKNKEKRTVPLNVSATGALNAVGKVRHISGYVFTSENGKLKGQHLYRGVSKAAKRAGIPPLRFHDLRHTFASRQVQGGIDLYTVKELLGHKTITMTMRYAHHSSESLRHGVEILDTLSRDNATICYNSATVGKKRGVASSDNSPKVIEMT